MSSGSVAGSAASAGGASVHSAASRRSVSARLSTTSAAAAAAAAAAATTSPQNDAEHNGLGNDLAAKVKKEPALVTALSYRGMEVLFTTSTTPSAGTVGLGAGLSGSAGARRSAGGNPTPGTTITGIFARTHAPFQTLDLPDHDDKSKNDGSSSSSSSSVTVVALVSNPTTGLICAATSDGRVHTYYPVETLPAAPGGLASSSTAPLGQYDGVDDGIIAEEAGEIEIGEGGDAYFADDKPSGGRGSNGPSGAAMAAASTRPVAAFGRYRWLTGRVIDCTDVFDVAEAEAEHDENMMEKKRLRFERRRREVTMDGSSDNYAKDDDNGDAGNDSSKQGPSRHVILSTSLDWKVLVVHGEQMAVFDVAPVDLVDGSVPGLDYGGAIPPTHAAFEFAGSPLSAAAENSPPASPGGTKKDSSGGGKMLLPPPAALLWTVKTPATIVTASLSGNGRAIVYVLSGEGEGVPYPYGARTYVRDGDDGAASSPPSQSPESSPMPTRKGLSPKQMKQLQKNMMNVSISSDLSNIGIVYKAGPFLNHSAPVTRVSFRGLGLNHSTLYSPPSSSPDDSMTSAGSSEEEGNDLLLTCCRKDSTCRVFSQNSWKQLLQWTAPPSSRADWVQGIIAANLGDLDVAPARKKGGGSGGGGASSEGGTGTATQSPAGSRSGSRPGSSPASRRPSGSSDGGGSGGINRHLLGQDGSSQPFQSLPSHPTPSSNAGAWISELTFRGGFPALRLSRLSYLKSGSNNTAPAHFESVAAILPPGTLNADAVLGGRCGSDEDYVMTVQGLWCGWDPWECGHGGNQMSSGGDLAGSALALLGGAPASTLQGGSLASLGTGNLGGSHAPPSELRIISSHGVPGKAVIMEFPLWGDRELGAMELGSPYRYLLSLPGFDEDVAEDLPSKPLPAVIDFESSHLNASVSDNGKAIDLTWRKKGSMNVTSLAPKTAGSFTRIPSLESMASTTSLDSGESHTSSGAAMEDPDINECLPKRLRDCSSTPLPLSLPPLLVPSSLEQESSSCSDGDYLNVVEAIGWWPDENFGGPPRLLALTRSGTVIVYEMPPPWSALEPPMPVYDPFSGSGGSSLASGFSSPIAVGGVTGVAKGGYDSDDGGNQSDDESKREEYEVTLQPHPDFGIGLRLEAQARGMPAVAGSFKKHPLSNGRLPAEKTEEITLGDELLAVNGVSLEGLSFDDIIGRVRDIGAQAKGGPLTMRFRPAVKAAHESRAINSTGSSSGQDPRRTIFGSPSNEEPATPTKTNYANATEGHRSETPVGAANEANGHSVLVGADSEVQQEFGRIVGYVRKARPPAPQHCLRPMIVLPWNQSDSAFESEDVESCALVVTAEGRTITVSRLDITDTCAINPEGARIIDLGDAALDGNDNRHIESLSIVNTATVGWCFGATDSSGEVSFVFVDVESVPYGDGQSSSRAVFRHYKAFQCEDMVSQSSSTNVSQPKFKIRPSSVDLFAAMAKGINQTEVAVWSAAPRSIPWSSVDPNASDWNYVSTKVSHSGKAGGKEPILDFRWVTSGSLDAFPWLVTFSASSAVVHRRPGGQLRWISVAELSYSPLFRSSQLQFISTPYYKGRITHGLSPSPADVYPHIVSALRIAVTASDEKDFLRSDWHPESILASICTEEGGVQLALKRSVQGLFRWLSLWMSPDVGARPQWNSRLPLGIAPFGAVSDMSVTESDLKNEEDTEQADNAAALMSSIAVSSATPQKAAHTEEDVLMFELQAALCPSRRRLDERSKNTPQRKKVSKEFKLAMGAGGAPVQGNGCDEDGDGDYLPDPLKKLNRDELRFLWALGEVNKKPPKFNKLDKFAQLTALCAALMRSIDSAKTNDDDHKELEGPVPRNSTGRAFLVKRSSSFRTAQEEAKPPVIASAACLAALVCDTQSELLDSLRKPNEKMDWPTARALNLPFWLRSDAVLCAIAEEIAQDVFKKKRDVMECAIFYVATRNMRSLRNFAAADQSQSGKMFFKFITQHDFASQRGRKAAEKNAYSLLRKRRYGVAAAFFLLAEPPMVKSALEIIVTQMKDLSLAFMISRLVEQSQSAPTAGGLNLSAMGGGGGFADAGGGGLGVGGATTTSTAVDETSFVDWTPKVGDSTRNLLTVRGLFMVEDDPFLEAVQQVWLGRQNQAALCISRLPAGDDDVVVPPVFDLNANEKKKYDSANDRVLSKANKIIDFSSAPLLLKRLKTSNRVRYASALLVSRALARRGNDLASMKTLLHAVEENVEMSEASEKKEKITGQEKAAAIQAHPKQTSIFDSFDAPVQRPRPKPTPSDTDSMQSSIFDSFDAPVQKPKPKPPPPPPPPPPADGGMQSSIFDSFDAAPQKPKPPPPPPPPADGGMQSSIFDSFDAAPQKPKPPPPPPPPADGGMQSSIFDSFDAAPQRPRSTPSTPSTADKSYSAVGSTAATSAPNADNAEIDEEDDEGVNLDLPVPSVWKEWRDDLLSLSVARRLLREIARIAARLEGDVIVPPMAAFRRHVHPLITHNASHVLQYRCQGDAILSSAERCLEDLTEVYQVDKVSVIEQALLLLACPLQPRRIVFAVLLYCLMERPDLAEDVIRNAANDQIRKCESFAYANDELYSNRKTQHHISSQYIRRQATGVSLQLELCLWLHRGGVFTLSGMAVKEAVISVRTGYLVAGWGRCYESLETMLKNDPDCHMDHDMGRQLWSSMKIMSSYDEATAGAGGGTTSGGWEFLVDCQRNEATAMLRDTEPGTFLIRPHSEDHGVFSLSFRTNLTVTEQLSDGPQNQGIDNTTSSGTTPIKQPADETAAETAAPTVASTPQQHSPKPPSGSSAVSKPPNQRPVKKDDIVQHAIVRLSDAGFRCGSFGPFTSLIKLLEAVSSSLPFSLRFDQPPIQGIIKEQTLAPSPNSVFIRKLALHSKTENYRWNAQTQKDALAETVDENGQQNTAQMQATSADTVLQRRFGLFSQLLALTELRKQLSAIAAAEFGSWRDEAVGGGTRVGRSTGVVGHDDDFQEGLSEDSFDIGEEEIYAMASRVLRPLLNWCRTLETGLVHELAPGLSQVVQEEISTIDIFDASAKDEVDAEDIASASVRPHIDGGDSDIRLMIQPDSGVEFRTLRVGEGNNSSIVVMFSKKEAIAWFISSGAETDDEGATRRLERMENRRIIEQLDLNELAVGKSYGDSHDSEKDVRYRFVDPWEVEVVESREGEVASATIGRGHYLTFNIGRVAKACELMQRSLGGVHLLALWSFAKGGICLTKALASVHPPWERDAGGDLQMKSKIVTEPTPFANSIRQHLYRNMLFRRLQVPQRFLALLQVELLDLKNLTSPAGSSSLMAYALLRLKRPGSGAPLTHKARTLDSACTQPQKIIKISGPNAPASWGSLVRLRFPLPEGVDCDGISYDDDCEALFKGPPSVLQLTVYEKKFMSDAALGGADIKLDALTSEGQLEEWVPLRAPNDGEITWFARVRLTLRFELMCLVNEEETGKKCPSVGLTKIHALSKAGGAHEDAKGTKRVISSPDFVQYLESYL